MSGLGVTASTLRVGEKKESRPQNISGWGDERDRFLEIHARPQCLCPRPCVGRCDGFAVEGGWGKGKSPAEHERLG